MSNVFKDSQYGFAISALGDNQVMVEAEVFADLEQVKIVGDYVGGDMWNGVGITRGLLAIVLPLKVKKISTYSFSTDTLKKIERTSQITLINAFAFTGAAGLESIDLSNVRTIGGNAFEGCAKLETIQLPKVETIGNECFKDAVKAEIYLNENVQSVGTDAFNGIKHLYYNGNLPGAPWGALAWN